MDDRYSRERHHSRRRKRFLAVFNTKKIYQNKLYPRENEKNKEKKRGEGWRERERERKSTRASLDCGQDEKIVSPVKTFDVKSHSRSPTQKSLSHRTVKRANSILEKKRKKKFVQIYEHTQYADVFFL